MISFHATLTNAVLMIWIVTNVSEIMNVYLLHLYTNYCNFIDVAYNAKVINRNSDVI